MFSFDISQSKSLSCRRGTKYQGDDALLRVIMMGRLAPCSRCDTIRPTALTQSFWRFGRQRQPENANLRGSLDLLPGVSTYDIDNASTMTKETKDE